MKRLGILGALLTIVVAAVVSVAAADPPEIQHVVPAKRVVLWLRMVRAAAARPSGHRT